MLCINKRLYRSHRCNGRNRHRWRYYRTYRRNGCNRSNRRNGCNRCNRHRRNWSHRTYRHCGLEHYWTYR